MVAAREVAVRAHKSAARDEIRNTIWRDDAGQNGASDREQPLMGTDPNGIDVHFAPHTTDLRHFSAGGFLPAL